MRRDTEHSLYQIVDWFVVSMTGGEDGDVCFGRYGQFVQFEEQTESQQMSHTGCGKSVTKYTWPQGLGANGSS